jgi:hypothetical protein
LTKAQTLAEAYAEGGFVRKNAYWSWSAVDPSRPAVALTIWEDQIQRGPDFWIVDPTAFRDVARWQHRNGNKERIRNIRYGLDQCDGWFHLVWIKAGDPEIEPRSVTERRYLSDRRGHIAPEDFDPETGVFRMVIRQI